MYSVKQNLNPQIRSMPTAASAGRLIACLLFIPLAGCAAPAHAESPTARNETTPPDAVIELWNQTWTQQPDGTVIYHEKKHVRLNSDRAYDEFADPRMTYNVDTDELEIITAHVKRADGTYRALPDYSHVPVSPHATEGWPAFSAIRQHLIVMSGIEPGCVVELEYKVTTAPGVFDHIAADVRLDHKYPVRERTIEVAVPAGNEIRAFASGFDEPVNVSPGPHHRWTFQNLPAIPAEPASPPWQTRCRRLAFSSAGLPSAWISAIHAEVEQAADSSQLIADLAAEWTKDIKVPTDRLRALRKALTRRFTVVEFPTSWQRHEPRPASQLIQCNYGTPAEANILLLSLARAAGLKVKPGLLVNDEVWHTAAPQDSMITDYVVLLIERPENTSEVMPMATGAHDTHLHPQIWSMRHGRIVRDARWAGYTILPVPDVLLPRTLLPTWTRAAESVCDVRGTLTIAADGTCTGELHLLATGLFVSAEQLRTQDTQKRQLNEFIDHVLPALNVADFSVETLAPDTFEVVAQVNAGAVEMLHGCRQFTFAGAGPHAVAVDLPLTYATRKTPVRIPGPFIERIDITLTWPNAWHVQATPVALARITGDWGALEQSVRQDASSLTLARYFRINSRDSSGDDPAMTDLEKRLLHVNAPNIAADDFRQLHDPLNLLRTERARTLLLKP